MLKIGVIGDGQHAGRMISLINEGNKADVAAVYHPGRLSKLRGGTVDFDDILSCDAILILSPNETHFDYLLNLAAQYEGYVFCEKPPVTTFEQLSAIVDLDWTRTFFNFNFRFSPWANALNKAMIEGAIGQIIHIDISWTHGHAFSKAYGQSWRADSTKHRHGILETVAIHPVDLLLGTMGEVDDFIYYPSNVAGKGTTFDTGLLAMHFKSGATASILTSYASPFSHRLSITGSDGTILEENSKLLIRSPRDTFNEKGRFTTPPVSSEIQIDSQDMYLDSLSASLTYFLDTCADKRNFPKELFDQSLASNRLVLNIGNCQE